MLGIRSTHRTLSTMKKLLLVAIACAALLNACVSVERRDHYDHDRYDECLRHHDRSDCDRWWR